VEIDGKDISKPSHEILIEHYDTVVVPEETEIIETEIPVTNQQYE
jgi:hypothetical protein